MRTAGDKGGLETDRESHDDVGSGTGLRGISNILHRPVVVVGVVEGDPEESYGEGNTHEPCQNEVDPAGCCPEEIIDPAGKEDCRDEGGNIVSAVHGVHRVSTIDTLDGKDTDHACEETERTHDDREQDPVDTEDWEERDTEDHCTDVLGCSGLEEVSATACTVPDIVADKVCNGGRVPDIVFRDTGFDLADNVCTDISGFRVDTATELGEECHERGTEGEPDDDERGVLRICTEGDIRQRDAEE
jgi:hypothetical protein